jgi:hypothetical protein
MNTIQIALLAAIVLFLSVTFLPRSPAPENSTSRNASDLESPERRTTGTFTDADFARHVEQLKKKLPSNDFTIVVQSPFVVIGDEAAATVQDHSVNTVKWAVDRLKLDFFTKDPKEILDIWLFKDADSYQRNTQILFAEKPGTPYGYYSSAHRALIMNISTGGGTLVHEIVHPFIEANFPECPPWFNEGLGSLYEQTGDLNGHLHGYPNWRLPGLQNAIRAGKVPSFKTLMSQDAQAFYNQDPGTNYSQSRYLCYYLQERGLLVRYYREFRAHQKQDSSGYKTLQRILGASDMAGFKRRWENFVLGLSQGYTVTSTAPARRD